MVVVDADAAAAASLSAFESVLAVGAVTTGFGIIVIFLGCVLLVRWMNWR